MKVLIDLYKIKDPYSGLGQFSLQFANAIIDQHRDDIQFNFLLPRGLEARFIPEPKVFRVGTLNRLFPVFNSGFDVWHSLQQFPSFYPSKGTKQILTIHDLNFLKEKDPVKARRYMSRLQKNIDRAEMVTTISEYTKSEVLKHCGVKGKEIRTIHNGIQGFTGSSIKPHPAPERPFFFSIGIFSEKKNFHKLVELLPYFDGHNLVLAGRKETNYGTQIEELIKTLGLEDRVHLVGRISDEEKRWYYENCEAFLFPSSAEGFGMPVIEAMQHGKPVVLSNLSSLPEIGGEDAYFFESLEPQKMAETIKIAITTSEALGESFEEVMKNRGALFNWHKAIQAYIDLYKSLQE